MLFCLCSRKTKFAYQETFLYNAIQIRISDSFYNNDGRIIK
jgi:hypothetical protein